MINKFLIPSRKSYGVSLFLSKFTLDALSKLELPCTIADVAKYIPRSRIIAYLGIGYLVGKGEIKIKKIGNRWVIFKA